MADAPVYQGAPPAAPPAAPAAPPAAPAAPPAAPLIADTDWRSELPEDIRGHDSFKEMSATNVTEALGVVARMHINSQAMIGRDKVVLPGKDSTPEEYRKFYTDLGCPLNATDYELPGELPPTYQIDEAAKGAFFAEAHEMGLTKSQAARLIRFHALRTGEAQKMQADASAEGIKESDAVLRREWGTAYAERLLLAQDAVERFGGQELKNFMDATGLGNNHVLCKAFAEIGKMVRDDEILGGGAHARFRLTPDEAAREIITKERDPEFTKVYQDEYHPGHKDAVAEMQRLHEIAMPTKEPEPIVPPMT